MGALADLRVGASQTNKRSCRLLIKGWIEVEGEFDVPPLMTLCKLYRLTGKMKEYRSTLENLHVDVYVYGLWTQNEVHIHHCLT